MFKFLLLFSKTIELRLSYLNVVLLVLVVTIVVFSQTKVNLIHTIILRTITIFLDYNVSKDVDRVSEFKTTDSAIMITNNRYLREL